MQEESIFYINEISNEKSVEMFSNIKLSPINWYKVLIKSSYRDRYCASLFSTIDTEMGSIGFRRFCYSISTGSNVNWASFLCSLFIFGKSTKGLHVWDEASNYNFLPLLGVSGVPRKLLYYAMISQADQTEASFRRGLKEFTIVKEIALKAKLSFVCNQPKSE